MKINRAWAMPSGQTFSIKPIKELILSYLDKLNENSLVLDPFANKNSIKQHIKDNIRYISNDLDTQHNTNYHLEAQDFLKMFEDNSVDVILYDPPFSNRQVSELYKKLNKTVTYKETGAGYFVQFKKEIQRVLKPNGIVITCGWNSNGVGMKYGMELIEILLVAHGGAHNDTIVTVERKV